MIIMEQVGIATSGAHEAERVLHNQTHTSFLISDILDSAPRSRCSIEDSGDEHSAELNSEEANSDDDKDRDASDLDSERAASAGVHVCVCVCVCVCRMQTHVA